MVDAFDIALGAPSEAAEIEALYRAAFTEEDLTPLLNELLDGRTDVLSLTGRVDGALAAHIAFTDCAVSGAATQLSLLGPLAVAPTRQRQGLGSAMVRAGLDRIARRGVAQVFALGDPNYYGRFGFEPNHDVGPPYALPAQWRDAWRSKALNTKGAPVIGQLLVPEPWRKRSLWST